MRRGRFLPATPRSAREYQRSLVAAGRLVVRGGRCQVAGREIALRQRQRVIGEGDARREVEQRESERKAAGPGRGGPVGESRRRARSWRRRSRPSGMVNTVNCWLTIPAASAAARQAAIRGCSPRILQAAANPSAHHAPSSSNPANALRHQGIEENVVRRFVGEIGIGARQGGGFVVRKGQR